MIEYTASRGFAENPKPSMSTAKQRYRAVSAGHSFHQSHDEVGNPWMTSSGSPAPSTRQNIRWPFHRKTEPPSRHAPGLIRRAAYTTPPAVPGDHRLRGAATVNARSPGDP